VKIKLSLRLYFFASIVILGSLITLGFAVLSVNYYVDGLDRGINGIMYELSQSTDVSDGQPKEMMGFHVASRWQDTPVVIQQRFSPPEELGVLVKSKDHESLFDLPEKLYFVVAYPNSRNEPRFVSRIVLKQQMPDLKDNDEPQQRVLWMSVIAISAILLFAFFLVILMKKVAKPVELLGTWAKSLNPTHLQQEPPDFTYHELNSLASLIRQSLMSANESVAREQQFLSFASHELRTPIAVIRSNVELLKRLSENAPLSDKQQSTFERIERAGLTMSDLTNTLLWLSRDDDHQSQPVPVNLAEIITSLCTELAYLLNDKQVDVEINTDTSNAITIVDFTACHIVLANLIRNAFQHTQHGTVTIKQYGTRIAIENCNLHVKTANHTDSNRQPTTGFGLGLLLSEKIIKRYGWQYEIMDELGRYEVIVDFARTS
jgi:signal transduction histidine kinase